MCQVGDVISIKNYKDQREATYPHAFVVISVEPDKLNQIPYNLTCTAISAFKDENHRIRKMESPGNFPFNLDEHDVEAGKSNAGYIKADQLFYFQSEMIDKNVIGKLEPEKFNALISFIVDSKFEILDIIASIY